jgi:hypothetical protein
MELTLAEPEEQLSNGSISSRLLGRGSSWPIVDYGIVKVTSRK